MDYYIALDVGGTAIKAGVLDSRGEVINNNINSYAAKADKNKKVVLENILDVIKRETMSINTHELSIKGVGLAFPGPFDYEAGRSLIQGIGKYDDLYGINVKEELLKLIYEDSILKNLLHKEFIVKFENDAALYALGESFAGKGKEYNRVFYICIGTGIGSAFMEEGKLIKYRSDIPENGWIYNTPFKQSIIDDYISARGIVKIAEIVMGKYEGTVKNLYDKAQEGDKEAIECFKVFGNMLGEALLPFIINFKPEAIVIGGKISRSYKYFKGSFIETLSGQNIMISVSENSSISTLKGVYNLLNNF